MQQVVQLLNTISNQQVNPQQINNLLQKCQYPELFFSLVTTQPHILQILKLQKVQQTSFFNRYVFGSIRKPSRQQLQIMKQDIKSDVPHIIAQLYISKQQNQLQSLSQKIQKLLSQQYLEPSCKDEILKSIYNLMKRVRSQNYKSQKEQFAKILALRSTYQSEQDKMIILDTLWKLDQKTLYQINAQNYLVMLLTINQQLMLHGYDYHQQKLKQVLFTKQIQDGKQKTILSQLIEKRKCRWGMLLGLGIDYENINYVRANRILSEYDLKQKIKQLLHSKQKEIDQIITLIQKMSNDELIWLSQQFENISQLLVQYITQYNPDSQIEECQVNIYFLKCIRQKNTKEYFNKTMAFYEEDVIISSYSSQKKIEKIFCMLTNCLEIDFKIQQFNDSRFFNQILKLLKTDYFYRTGCYNRVQKMCEGMTIQNQKLLLKTITQNQKISNSKIILLNTLNPSNEQFVQMTKIIYEEILQTKACQDVSILQYLANLQSVDSKILDIIQSIDYQPEQIYHQNLQIIILLKNSRKLSSNIITQPRFTSCYLKYGIQKKIIELKPNSKKSFVIQQIKQNIKNGKSECSLQQLFTFSFSSLHFNDLPLVWSWIANPTTDNQFYHNHWYNSLLLNLVQISLNIANQEKIVKSIKTGLQILKNIVNKEQVLHNSQEFYEDLYKLKYLYLLFSNQYLKQIEIQLLGQIVDTLLLLIRKFNHPLSRQYIEVILCRCYLALPSQKHELVQKQMIKMLNLNLNISVPIILTLGYEMLKTHNKQLLSVIGKFIGCHIAYIRGISQYYLSLFLEQQEVHDDFLKQLKQFWKVDKDTKKIMKNIAVVVNGFKEAVQNQLDFLGFQRVQQYPSQQVQKLFKKDAYYLYKQILLVPSLQSSMKKQLLQQIAHLKQIKLQHIQDLPLIKPPKVIIIATLLEKVHNFGHIIRTLHTHNAMLVVSSRQSLLHQQCLQLVPENHDVRIIQIKQHEQQTYISLQKKLGYQMIALQQCSNSVSLENFQFPQKMMMLLGNQRLGAPSKLLKMADHLVQIPQAGKIRSLNVHVSMVICLWQYLKQHF